MIAYLNFTMTNNNNNKVLLPNYSLLMMMSKLYNLIMQMVINVVRIKQKFLYWYYGFPLNTWQMNERFLMCSDYTSEFVSVDCALSPQCLQGKLKILVVETKHDNQRV